MLIDTHTHLYLPEFGKTPEGGGDEEGLRAVDRALAAGVGHLVFPNVDLDTIRPMRELAKQRPGKISMAMGLHPTSVNETWRETMAAIMAHIDHPKAGYVAVGEVGIDLYWDVSFADEQMRVFDWQVAKAISKGLPVIIHCRDGLDQTLEVLQGRPGAKAVFHSFGGTEADVERIRRVGDFYFGINGTATFKNCRVREALPAIGLGRLLLETDSPYLAPVPHRGKRNESAYLPLVADYVAEQLGVGRDAVEETTTANAIGFFNLPIA